MNKFSLFSIQKNILKIIKLIIDVIKDLIKYLRRDDESHVVRQFLGQTKLLQTDLIKIFVDHSDKLQLWDVLLRQVITCSKYILIFYILFDPITKKFLILLG